MSPGELVPGITAQKWSIVGCVHTDDFKDVVSEKHSSLKADRLNLDSVSKLGCHPCSSDWKLCKTEDKVLVYWLKTEFSGEINL